MLFSQVCPYHSLDYMNHSKDLTAHIPGQNSLRVMFRFIRNPHQGDLSAQVHADPFHLLSRSFNHWHTWVLSKPAISGGPTPQSMFFPTFSKGSPLRHGTLSRRSAFAGKPQRAFQKIFQETIKHPEKNNTRVKERWLKRMETESTPRTFTPCSVVFLGAYPQRATPKKHARALRVEIRLRGLTAVELQALADALPEHVQRRVRLHDLVPQAFSREDNWHNSRGSFQPLFSTIVLFQRPAASPGVLMVFWKEGSLERMGKCPLEPCVTCWVGKGYFRDPCLNPKVFPPKGHKTGAGCVCVLPAFLPQPWFDTSDGLPIGSVP